VITLEMYCLGPVENEYSMHAFGFDDGPELPLCNAHGAHRTPTLETIWARTNAYPKAVLDMIIEAAGLT
jgi:hypothetical protein